MDKDNNPNTNPVPINLSVTLPTGSVMIPSWLAVCFVVCFVLSTFTLVLVWNASSRLVSEIRVLQIYEEDVESVLIRSGIATRSDFIPRNPNAVKSLPNNTNNNSNNGDKK